MANINGERGSGVSAWVPVGALVVTLAGASVTAALQAGQLLNRVDTVEARVISSERRYAELEARRDQRDRETWSRMDSILDKLSETNERLSRLEGRNR